MKRNYKFMLTLPGVLLAIGGLLMMNVQTNHVHANGSGAPAGRTGSPGDGSNCTACHSGTPQTASPDVTISSDIPASGYIPGNTYTISVEGVQQNVSKFGFEITAEDNTNTKAGTWATINAETQIKSTDWVTHTLSGTSGNGFKTWTINWTAPAAGTGDVTFYAAVNATNSSGTNAGDLILLNNVTVSEDVSASVNEKSVKKVKFYPVPAKDYIWITDGTIRQATLYALDGRPVLQQSNVKAVNVSAVANGVYFLTVKTRLGTVTQKVIVNR